MIEVVELRIDGKSGDWDLERRKSKEVQAAWEQFKKMRLLSGYDLIMFVVPSGPPGQKMKSDLTSSHASSPTCMCRTKTSDPWPPLSSI